jgi:aminoacylase
MIRLSSQEAESAIESLQQFLRFPTVSAISPSSGAYRDCANFILQELASIPCLENIHFLPESPEHSPVVIAHWKGTRPELPVILLNSHYDVVPASLEEWTVPPFEGLRRDGKIYGRGSQDMKCVCIQYIEAIRYLNRQGFQPTRTMYLSFVPDEEVGGGGMAAFLESELFKHQLPGIALALDEGLASTDDTFSVFYGERLPWWVDITAVGNTGHGSRFIEETAVEQLLEMANKALEFREGQRKLLFSNPSHENCSHAVAAKKKSLGDVTSLNITRIQAGVQVGNSYAYNCVPPTASCSLDIRISPHTSPSDIGEMLDIWCRECSKSDIHKVTWKFTEGPNGKPLNHAGEHATTSTDVSINPWYAIFVESMRQMNLEFRPEVFPAATDSRFLRALGIRALGFSPMRNTEVMLHENDEYIPEETFLEGISVYVGLLKDLSNQAEMDEDTLK